MLHKTNFIQTLMHLLNGYIGSGILAMPKAFSDGGIVVSSIATPILGLIMNGCIHLLIRVNKHLCDKLCIAPMDYEDIAEKALSNGPKSLRRFSRIARYIVMTFLISSQLGNCSVFNIFIASNLRTFFMNVIPSNFSSLSVEYYLLILFPIMVLLSFVKSIRNLSIVSTFGNLLQVAGLGIIVYSLVTDVPSVNSLTKPVGTKLPLFFSSAVLSFEAINVAMPLYKRMENPKSYGKLFGVLNIAIVIVTAFYFTIGFLGYIKYGDDVAASLTLSLPKIFLYDCVKLMYALAVILTYPIILYGAIQMLWPLIEKKLQAYKIRDSTVAVTDYLFRVFMVMTTFALAVLIPNLKLIIALVGAVFMSCISIIFPTILHTITFWNETESRTALIWMCSRNCAILLFGLLVFFSGTYYSISDIVNEFS